MAVKARTRKRIKVSYEYIVEYANEDVYKQIIKELKNPVCTWATRLFSIRLLKHSGKIINKRKKK